MSEESKHYGYGVDVAIKFTKDNEIDFVISPTGDIAVVGGSGSDPKKQRLENAKQQIEFHIMTPFNSIRDANKIRVPIGSELHEFIGQRMTDINIMLLKVMVLSAIAPLKFIDSIERIEPVLDEKNERTLLRVAVQFKMKDDTEVYFTAVDLVEIERSGS